MRISRFDIARTLEHCRKIAVVCLMLISTASFAQVGAARDSQEAQARPEVPLWVDRNREVVLNREPLPYNSPAHLQDLLTAELSSAEGIDLLIQAHCFTPAEFIESIEGTLSSLGINRERSADSAPNDVTIAGTSSYRIEQPCSQEQQTFTDTHREILRSDVIDQDFVIFISAPREHETSDAAYPIVYFTDPSGSNDHLRRTAARLSASGEIPPPILVGIGYTTADIPKSLRCRELTPAVHADAEIASSCGLAEGISLGGADQFVGFIEQTLKPYIYANYRALENDETIMGHSVGGLFGAYVLLSHSDSFDRYVLSSTTPYFEDLLLASERQYRATNSDLAKNVFLSAGDLEAQEMRSHTLLLYNTLVESSYPGLTITHSEIPGANHLEAWLPAFSEGLKAVFAAAIGSH